MAKALEQRRYGPLGVYLRNLPASQQGVTLGFDQVEDIIGVKLPASARDHHHQWWANQSHGSRALHWDGAGFRTDGVDITKEQVRFARKDAVERPPRPLSLQEVVTEVNQDALGRPIGELQEWRRIQRGFTRLPSATLFYAKTEKDRHYAFHVGGLSELQFNVGFEEIDGKDLFRHGVAFSLQTTRELPDIEPLVPKIERLNEYFRIYPNAFAGLSMWHWTPDGGRSENSAVTAIPEELVKKGMFIFIGAVQHAAAIEIDWILDDFDRLLPLYQYVEGKADFPELARAKKGFQWSPGNKARAVRTKYERTAYVVDKTLQHNLMQSALFEHLEGIYGGKATSGEQDPGTGTSIDVAVKDKNGYTYYEIKTGLSARSCIREAFGQLMEYSFWPGSNRADRLVIVGKALYDAEARAYIKKLRKEFSLPIEYQQFDMKSGRLK
jgi:hypothetical protein